MLDGNDKETFHAIRLLRDVVDKHQKPIILWAGAGVSKWCGFPTWQESAEHFHSSFLKLEARYDQALGLKLLLENRLPELFELCQHTNRKTYNRELVSLFNSRTPTPVYSRFLRLANPIKPLQIITTNVDETLEHNISTTETIQKSNFERCLDLTNSATSFIAKLHGSISHVESTVFSAADYQGLLNDTRHLSILQSLFTQSIVVFIGYGLRDQYILDLLAANSSSRPLFGDGPHFLVSSGDFRSLPESIKTIRYLDDPYADHRSALTVLDIIRVVKQGGHVWFAPNEESVPTEDRQASAYFITDITPPGTWASSQSLVLEGQQGQGSGFNAVIGQGFLDSELPSRVSPAIHDLTVGLVSFDHIYVPLSYVGALHGVLGSEAFWNLVKASVCRFIHFEHQPVMMFRSPEEVSGGDIGWLHLSVDGGRPPTVDEEIRKQIGAMPGHEAEVENLFAILRAGVSNFDHERFNVPSLTRGALLHPSVRRLLGISDAVLPTSLPRWAAFPVIRLAHTIMIGCACENFALPAAKVGFGAEVLVGAAFAVSAARDWADSVTSYVITSRFNTDLGAFVQSNPSMWNALLDFRETQAGISLRREILDELATNAGSEFSASVNAGLKHIVPSSVMQNARDQLSALLFRSDRKSRVVPAVWTNVRNSDSIAALWRARCKHELEEYCRSRGLKHRHPCPCGSGELLRFCCGEALRA
ncbi:MAG TPA: SIR2 family protein [Candidatus Limnocylindrales bacterium]|nr:SIR2 family protein [Candidatus Limnocylindrales bacterium]